jgi:hypothetical protein|tara:strand:+ start:3975 stop:4181 length:207 start_codon:yes stop_codon:yes gene_type:complete
MSTKYEKITLIVATETYIADKNDDRFAAASGLDYILPAIAEMSGECQVLEYSTEDYKLVPDNEQDDNE